MNSNGIIGRNIPYYLDMMEKGLPTDTLIDRLFFEQGAPLRGEFDFLFRSLFKDSKIYRNVVEALSSKMKGLNRKEVSPQNQGAEEC